MALSAPTRSTHEANDVDLLRIAFLDEFRPVVRAGLGRAAAMSGANAVIESLLDIVHTFAPGRKVR
jgi:hypothetical protein